MLHKYIAEQFSRFFDNPGRHVITKVKEKKGGMTNRSFLVKTTSNKYIARVPGNNTSQFISRHDESFNTHQVIEAGLTPMVFHEEDDGRKITLYLSKSITMDRDRQTTLDFLPLMAATLNKLHTVCKPFRNSINVFDRNRKMLAILRSNSSAMIEPYLELEKRMDAIESIIQSLDIELSPCHNDTTPGNFILHNNTMQLIDFEYSGMNDPAWDLACLSIEAGLNDEQDSQLLCSYNRPTRDSTFEKRFTFYKPVVAYWVTLWCHVQLQNANIIDEAEHITNLKQRRLAQCDTLLARYQDMIPRQYTSQLHR